MEEHLTFNTTENIGDKIMIKEKKDIFKHLNNVVYNKIAAHKIVAFLLGQGLIRKGDKVRFKEANGGERLHTFEDFYRWYTTVNSNEILESLLCDLGDKLELTLNSGDFELADRVGLQLEFLIDSLGLDISKEKESE